MQVQTVTVHVSRMLQPRSYEKAEFSITLTAALEPGETLETVTPHLTAGARKQLFTFMEPLAQECGRLEEIAAELGVEVTVLYEPDDEAAPEPEATPSASQLKDIPF